MAQPNTTDHLDTVWLNARLATLIEGRPGLGIVESGAIGARQGRIAFVSSQAELPAAWRNGARVVDCEGRWITPALIDCHTHLVYGGNRAHEFELRLAGATYEEIAREGGGILSTVRATRAASDDELVRSALRRLDALIAEGVGTVEVKSGYGLDLDAERKSLRVARRLAEQRNVTIRATFLGAHALPPEFADNRDAYVAYVADTMIPLWRRRPDRRRRRVLRADCLHARGNRSRVCRREARRASGQAARRSIVEFRRRGARRRVLARCRPIISNMPTRTASPRWPAPASSRCCCPARIMCSRNDRRRRSTSCESIACRWPSPPISIRARRR